LSVNHRAESQPLYAGEPLERSVRLTKRPVESGERLFATNRAVRGMKANAPPGAVRVQRPAEVEENQSSHSDNDPQIGVMVTARNGGAS